MAISEMKGQGWKGGELSLPSEGRSAIH